MALFSNILLNAEHVIYGVKVHGLFMITHDYETPSDLYSWFAYLDDCGKVIYIFKEFIFEELQPFKNFPASIHFWAHPREVSFACESAWNTVCFLYYFSGIFIVGTLKLLLPFLKPFCC